MTGTPTLTLVAVNLEDAIEWQNTNRELADSVFITIIERVPDNLVGRPITEAIFTEAAIGHRLYSTAVNVVARSIRKTVRDGQRRRELRALVDVGSV